MRSSKKFLKKSVAMLLSVLMLFTSFSSVLAVSQTNSSVDFLADVPNNNEPTDGKWNGTTGGLVANNYELNEFEKAILACTGLVGETYSVDIPGDADGLVSVDADTQTVTAKAYTDNGFVWEPTLAVIKYNAADGSAGTDIEVTMKKVGEDYVGTFTKPANSYRVEVTYSLYIPVDADLQQLLLNTPHYLVEGYDLTDAAVSGLDVAILLIQQKIEDLRALYNGIKYEVSYEGNVVYSAEIALPDGACKDALAAIIADYDSNDGQLTIAEYIDEYNKVSTSKVQFMMEKGAQFKEHIVQFYGWINAINKNKKALQSVEKQLRDITKDDGTIDSAIAEIDTLIDDGLVKAEEAVQTVINKAVKKAQDEYSLDISNLKGKTRENNAIYNEIQNYRDSFEETAKGFDENAATEEANAANYEAAGNAFLAKLSREAAKKYREAANTIRTTGIGALNDLETGIRTIYKEVDDAVAALKAKQNELRGMKDPINAKADDVNTVTRNIGSVANMVEDYAEADWAYTKLKLVKDGITAEEYAALDEAVIAAYDSGEDIEEHDDFEIKDKLLAYETVITARVDQYVVYVEVKAQVVPKASVDSTKLDYLKVFNINFPMDKETAAKNILDAIVASGVEDSALTQWDSYYNVSSEKYNRTVTIKDKDGKVIDKLGALNGDIYYTISYAPKNVKIREIYNNDNVVEVPYGYNWRLPRPTELTKSYLYEINGVSHRENTIVRVVEDIAVERTEGKAIVAKTLAEIVAASKIPGAELSAKEKAVLNSNAFLVDTVFFRTPDSNDKLTAVTANGTGYKLVAQAMNAGLISDTDAEWIPVKAYPVSKTGTILGAKFGFTKDGNDYVAEFDCDEIFHSVQVEYQLSIEGLDANTVEALANIAGVLVEDTTAQKKALDTLCNENNFYAYLGEVNKTILGTLGTVAPNMSQKAKDSVKFLTDNCMDPVTEQTYLHGYLTRYMSDGLGYYYKGENAKNIANQIALVNEHLPIIWNDPEVRAAASKVAAGAVAKVDSVIAQLKAADLKPINALVNTNSAYIDNMLAAVAANGVTADHSNITGTVVMETILSASAPGMTTFGVEIQVLNKNDGIVESYKSEDFAPVGTTISVAQFEAMYNALLATIPNTKYYTATKNLPTEGVILGENASIHTSALRPVTYTVKIDGEEDQILYAFDAYTVTLPGTGNNGLKYVYDIGGKEIEVLSGALENYALATSIDTLAALFGADRELVITRKLVDTNKDNLLKFVSNFNNAFANAGFTFGNNLAAAFIPVEDKDGNLAIVLRITSNYGSLSPMSLASEMMALVQDLSYVGINDSPLFGLNSDNELKLHLQTVINMLVNSGLGLDTFSKIIDTNGNIRELKLEGMSAVGAKNNTITVSNGKVINNVNALGGKLMESTMQYGVNINNATSVPFYVTYQDFDTQADMLKQVKKGAEQIRPFVDLSCSNGALNMSLNLPDNAYAYIITSLLITGQIDFKTIQSYKLDDILGYMGDLIDPIFEDEGANSDTFINTIKQTGLFDSIENFDTEANKALVDFVYDTIDHLFDNTAENGDSVEGLYTGELTYDALDVLLNNKVALEDYTSMIAELDSGLTLPITFNLKNRDTHYEALVLDINGTSSGNHDGIIDTAEKIHNKYYLAKKAIDAIGKAADNAMVILLSDIRGDVVFNNDVVLNLNGYTIQGDLIAKDRAVIIDSTLSTKKCGSVIGDLIVDGGSFKIGAGKYLTDVSKYLEDGYYLNNSIVSNGCFNLVAKGQNLDIYLGTDYLSLDKSAAKVMATDLLAKLIMNYYACSELKVNGNGIYEVDLINVTESLDTLSVLLGKIVECIDCAGSSAFATEFMADVTDFAALADAIDNETALIGYTIQQSAFNPYMEYVDNGDDSYFSFNLSSSDVKKVFRINVFVSDEVDADHKDKMSAVLRELDNITTFNEMKVDITDVTYGQDGFSMEGAAAADIVVDLSTNVNYPIIIAAILAYDSPAAYRAEIVNAIKAYQTTNSTKNLMKVLENMSIADLMSALKNTKSKSLASILNTLGISADNAVELESHYTIARKIVGTLIEYSGKQGNAKTLAGLKVANEFATYTYRIERSKGTYAEMTLKLFSEEKAIVVKDNVGNIYMNTDDLVDAITAAKAGYTVYVNHNVALTKDINLAPISIKLVGAENISFNGFKLWFTDVATTLITDKDISANVACDESLFCSSVEYTKDGEWFVFKLNGEKHEWETIPAVEPKCGVPGSTEGSWCKHCHVYNVEPQEVPALEHKYTADVTLPDCFNDGYTTYTCDNCGDSYVNDYVDATNHEGTIVNVPGKEATCTEAGYTESSHCTACGTVFKPALPIPAGHKEVPIIDKEATCTEEGLSGATKCEICGIIINAGTVIPVKDHETEIVPGYPANCTETGLTDGEKCKVCGITLKEQEIIPITHKPKAYDKKPTCTESGIAGATVCEICGTTIEAGTVVPPTPHEEEIVTGRPATCTEDGLTDGKKCKHCGITLEEQQIIHADHKRVKYSQAPDCENPGFNDAYKCEVCGEKLSDGVLVLPLGHNVTITEGKPATCTENGYTASAYCSVCDHVHVAPTIIKAKGHNIVDVEGKDPTCTELGYTDSSYCTICKEVFTAKDPILPTGHTAEVIPGQEATVDQTGLTEGSKCSVCGVVLVEQKVLAKLPFIHAPVPNVTTDGNIRGAKVDEANKQIFLDVNPEGFTVAEFVDVNFKIDNAPVTNISIYNYNGMTKRADSDIVCNGDSVVVKAKNADGVETSVKYNIIIVGDANCDGYADVRDSVLIKLAYMEELVLNDLATIAADVNYDGETDIRDVVIIESKYVLWPENEYVSQTK